MKHIFKINQFQWLGLLLGCAFLHCAYAADTQKATLYVNKPYDQVQAMLQANLQRCVTKKAGFFNSGRELVSDNIETTIIYHVKEYQITGEIIDDLGSVVVSDEHGKTVIVVTNQPNSVGKDLHLIESIRNWVKGNEKCVPNTGGILS